MQVSCYGEDIEIPDLLIDKYTKDFECLPGKGLYNEINQLRNSISEVVELVAEDPDILNEKEYMTDFVRALAMKKALETHGIFYDA
jgi:hypothetical protein